MTSANKNEYSAKCFVNPLFRFRDFFLQKGRDNPTFPAPRREICGNSRQGACAPWRRTKQQRCPDNTDQNCFSRSAFPFTAAIFSQYKAAKPTSDCCLFGSCYPLNLWLIPAAWRPWLLRFFVLRLLSAFAPAFRLSDSFSNHPFPSHTVLQAYSCSAICGLLSPPARCCYHIHRHQPTAPQFPIYLWSRSSDSDGCQSRQAKQLFAICIDPTEPWISKAGPEPCIPSLPAANVKSDCLLVCLGSQRLRLTTCLRQCRNLRTEHSQANVDATARGHLS